MKKRYKKIDYLSKILKNHVIEKSSDISQKRSAWTKKTLSPSVDFMCSRKTFFNLKYTGVHSFPPDKKDITYENERAKENGNSFHEVTQKRFEEMGIVLLNEYTLEDPDRKIKARIDSLVEIQGEIFLVELKSSKDYSLKMLVDQGAPSEDHQKQLQLYFHLFDVCKDDPKIKEALRGRILNKGLLFYENKNDHSIVEFLVHKDKEIIEKLLSFADNVWISHEKDTAPPVPFQPDSPECLYKCSSAYYNKCHNKLKPDKINDTGVWGFADAKKLNNDPKFR